MFLSNLVNCVTRKSRKTAYYAADIRTLVADRTAHFTFSNRKSNPRPIAKLPNPETPSLDNLAANDSNFLMAALYDFNKYLKK